MSLKSEVEKILNDEYGIGIAHASGPVGLWASAKCTDPKGALKALNRVLKRHGNPLCYAPYGDPCF